MNLKHPEARSRTRRNGGVLAFMLAAAALMACLFATGAQAVTFSHSGELDVGLPTTSVAVDQASGDVYVSASGSTTAVAGEGTLKRFDSAGNEQNCTLSPNVEHPAGLAVDPANGRLDVINLSATAKATELRTFEAGCGPELPVTSGEADTTSGSTELTNVTTDHPLQEGQAIEGPGIPAATATADVAAFSTTLTNVSSVSGTFAVGQRITGDGIYNNVTIAGCTPSCSAPTELTLSGATYPFANGTGEPIVARTIVASTSGATVTLSNPAEATATGVDISGTSWRLEGSTNSFPLGQPAVNSAGDVYWPNRQGNQLQKYTSFGEELVEGGFPNATSAKRAASVALDAGEDVFVVSSGTSTSFSCNGVEHAQLKKLRPDGTEFSAGEGGVTGPESVFANLTENTTAVAVDKSTGNVYVGRGCHESFTVEVYGPGGTKLAEGIGAGLFGITGTAPNHLAVNEETGALYAVDPEHHSVQVFDDTSAKKTLAPTVAPSGEGEVQCNGTGAACLSEYDEGQEVILEAVASGALPFKEWANGSGSAAACEGSTEPSCAFDLDADSTIEAVFGVSGPVWPLSLEVEGEGAVSAGVPPSPSSGAIAGCEAAGGECAAEYSEGAEVPLAASAASGSHFVEWQTVTGTEAGTCTGATASCQTAALTEAVKLKAVFAANPEFALTVNLGGTGSGTVECDTGSGPGACAPAYLEGAEVTLIDTPAPGSRFVGWIGCDSSTGTECEVTMSAAKTVEAVNDLTSKSPLTVFVTGHGTVSADSGPITGCTEAGGSACEGEYEGTVILTGTPESSTYVLAGWLGCRRATADSCEVTVDEAKEVTAVFLQEGTAGTPGSPGKSIVLTPITNAGLEGRCVGTGGVRVEVEGESATRRYICNGEEGLQGGEGEPGIPGLPGPQGPQGATGAQGPVGLTGATGAIGAAGPQGATGAQGPAGKNGKNGKDAKVTCKVKQKKGGKKVKVTCTVKYKGGKKKSGKAKGATVSWRLTKGGRLAAHGRSSLPRLGRMLSHLRPGHYVLHAAGRRTALRIPARTRHRGGHHR